MGGLLRAVSAAVALCAIGGSALAGSLTVSPILIDNPAPKATSTVTLESGGSEQLAAQVRIFKWTIVNGKDRLVPTKEVVASPPAVKVKPNGKAVVRIVRRSKTPAANEESYRLIVSEIPTAPKAKKGVSIAFQYSIPAFFTPPDAKPAVTWSVATTGGGVVVTAMNSGNRRLRLANMKLKKGSKAYEFGGSLSGYILAGTTRTWIVKGAAKGVKNGSTVQILAEGDIGDVNTTAVVGAAN